MYALLEAWSIDMFWNLLMLFNFISLPISFNF